MSDVHIALVQKLNSEKETLEQQVKELEAQIQILMQVIREIAR